MCEVAILYVVAPLSVDLRFALVRMCISSPIYILGQVHCPSRHIETPDKILAAYMWRGAEELVRI